MNYRDMPSTLNSDVPATKEEAIFNSLNNIISTPKGSVPGHPEFGCGIDKYIFELIDPMIKEAIKGEIMYAINRWEERIKVTEIEVVDDPDYNRVLIKIKYVIMNDIKGNEYDYIYKQELV